MSTVPAIDLSQLRLPNLATLDSVIEKSDYHETSLMRSFSRTIDERRNILSKAVNDGARSVLLATADGKELDHIAALYGIKRLLVKAAAPDASPPQTDIMESDDRLRMRARLSLEALSQAGCEGAYLFHALSASARIKDISVYSNDLQPEKINVVVLSDYGKGDGSLGEEEILKMVNRALSSARIVTDEINVRWAKVVEYPIHIELDVQTNIDTEVLLLQVKNKISDLVQSNHRLGKNILRDEFYSVIYQQGIENVRLVQPESDMALGIDSAPYNSLDEESKVTFKISTRRVADLAFITDQSSGAYLRHIRRLGLSASLKE